MKIARKLPFLIGFAYVLGAISLNHLKACDQNINDEISRKYVTVYFWGDNPQEQRFGHVSLRTEQSYISIRPNTQDKGALSFVTETGIKAYIKAPALWVSSYEDDCKLQGNKAPDQTFRIKGGSNVKKVDKKWSKILQARLKQESQTDIEDSQIGTSSVASLEASWCIVGGEENPINLPGVKSLDATWSLFSGPDTDDSLADGGLYANSASVVINAFKHGQVEVSSLLESQLRTRQIVGTLLRAVMNELKGEPDPQKLIKGLAQFGGYDFIFKPSDVATLCEGLIKKRVLDMLERDVREGNLIIDLTEVAGKVPITITPEQMKAFIASHFPPLFNEQTAFKDCLSSFGTLSEDKGKYMLKVHAKTISEFQKESSQYKSWCTLL